MGYRPVLEVRRGDVVESVHFGALAVATASGELVASWGDASTVTFLRSSAKPFQALPLLEDGTADRYQIPQAELALVCASHSGSDMHVSVAASLQARVGVSEGDLRCGTHPPYDRETAQRLRRQGQEPTPNRHNCSGKHTGMLAQARSRGEPLEGYFEPTHPVQRRILQTFAEMCGLDPLAVQQAIDGCSVPTFAVPLQAAATAYARLADPAQLGPKRAAACRRIFSAMTAHPELVGGWDRFDTQLMLARPGLVLSKGGAEGYQGLALPPGAAGPGSPALGVALKIADGDQGRRSDRPPGQRARARVVAAALRQLGVLQAADLERLSDFLEPELTNWRGLKVGEMRPCLQLERTGAWRL